jgi:NAD+ dependent glucose-6-phosphate dehydrogenase
MTRTVLITGAVGNLGRKLRAHSEALGWGLRLLDVDSRGDPRIVTADLNVWNDGWVSGFAGVDAVVHLAATPSPEASWPAVQRLNIDLTQNVYEAASPAGVRRLVFASSNWVMAGYRPAEGRLGTEMDPDPVDAYGVSELVGERMGRSYTELASQC